MSDLYRQCEKRSIHEMRVPCLPVEKVSYVEIPDIKFVHLARLNLVRQKNKEDFYEVSSIAKLEKRISAVSAFRSYHHPDPTTKTMEQAIELYSVESGDDMARLVKQDDFGLYYIEEMISIFKRDGYDKYLKLDVWDNPYMKAAGVCPKIPLKYRMLHSYLRKTMPVSDRWMIRFIDKLLKFIY